MGYGGREKGREGGMGYGGREKGREGGREGWEARAPKAEKKPVEKKTAEERKTVREKTPTTVVENKPKEKAPPKTCKKIAKKAMSIMNSFMNDIFEKLVAESSKLAKYIKRETISSREEQTAVKSALPEELAKHAMLEGTKVITKILYLKTILQLKTARPIKFSVI
ncbi:hypothetical protein SUGI_1098800 [Cryptomeria japonica]|nr:hypothetical protein SUGI_1098800 [Cryptomeria japonica]